MLLTQATVHSGPFQGFLRGIADLVARPRLARRAIAFLALGALVAACAPTRVETPRYTQRPVQEREQRVAAGPQDTDPSQAGAGAPARVALLLPLSGEHEFIGQAMQRAAEMAVFEAGNDNFSLIPIDTRGTAEGARAAANQAAARNVDLILGPLFSHSVQAARGPAAAAGIQIIGFSTDPSVAGGNVYLLSFLPRPQVSRILEYAGRQGINRVAVLAPNNPYGRTVATDAREVSLRLNVEITRVAFYDPSGEGLNDSVRDFAGVVEMRRREDDTAPRAVRDAPLDFEAVLLPDGGQRLRSVASLLAFYDVDPNQIRFLGTGVWDSPAVLQEQSLHGGWFAGPPPGSRERFVTKYRQAYQEEPPRIASLAYDSVALAAVLARRRGGVSDRITPSEITNPSGFLGIDGIFRFQPDGLSQRGVAVMEVTAEEFRLISPAPRSFEPGTN